MAKILSHVWSTIRGSIGGITYTTNQYGQIIARVRTAPVNPATEWQEMFRLSFEAANQDWRHLLGPTQRQDWHEYAQGITFHGAQGNYRITGREMFIRSIGVQKYYVARNMLAPYTELGPPDAVELPTVGNWTWSTPDAGETGFKVNFTNVNSFSGHFICALSRPFPSTRRRFKGPFLGNYARGSGLVAPFATESVKFVGLIPLQVYFVRARFIADRILAQSLSSKTFLRLTAITVIPEGSPDSGIVLPPDGRLPVPPPLPIAPAAAQSKKAKP